MSTAITVAYQDLIIRLCAARYGLTTTPRRGGRILHRIDFHCGLKRFISLVLIAALLLDPGITDARSLRGIASEARVSLAFWMNSAGLTSSLRRLFRGRQQGMPELMRQETQADRNG